METSNQSLEMGKDASGNLSAGGGEVCAQRKMGSERGRGREEIHEEKVRVKSKESKR